MPRLVTLGEAMLRLSPEVGMRISTTSTFAATIGGSELNVAIAAARWGIESVWMSSVPDNVLGERVLMHAHSHGVATHLAPSSSRLGTYFVEIGPAPRGSSIVYDRRGSAFSDLEVHDFDFPSSLRGADAVLTSGITLALSPYTSKLAEALYVAAPSALKVFEVNFRSALWSPQEAAEAVERILPLVDVLVASPHDLTELLGLAADTEDAADIAMGRYGLSHVLLQSRAGGVGETGTNDVSCYHGGTWVTAEAGGRVVDPVGAGDAATGTFLGALLSGHDLNTCVRASAQAAAVVQTLNGDALTASADELLHPSERRIRR
jgi:2-dehydro-3-deoxygluconokinase